MMPATITGGIRRRVGKARRDAWRGLEAEAPETAAYRGGREVLGGTAMLSVPTIY